MNDDLKSLNDFAGVARLFPLPNLVFFPHAIQPLHVFEPRYRKLTADALMTDRLIALVLLAPGWESHYEERPAIEPVACIGRIIADQLLPDGRSNLLLRGLGRARIIEEVVDDNPYRSARVELLPDRCLADLATRMELRGQLAETILPRFQNHAIAKQLGDLFHSELSLGALCDVLAFALPLPMEWKQKLLQEVREDVRAGMLLEGFESIAPPKIGVSANRKFPPDFSCN